MIKKIILAISILALLAATFIFVNTFIPNLTGLIGLTAPEPGSPGSGETGPPASEITEGAGGTAPSGGEKEPGSPGSNPARPPESGTPEKENTGDGGASSIPPVPVPGVSVDGEQVYTAKKAYGKATSLASKAPELSDVKQLIPVLLKFTPAEISTLTRLAGRNMTKEEIEQAKNILLAKLDQEDIDLLLQLGPEYGLDFRSVLGVNQNKTS